MEVSGGRDGMLIFLGLLKELESVPLEVVPMDEREYAAYAWALGATQRGYKTLEETLADKKLRARILDDFDDVAADQRLDEAMAGTRTRGVPSARAVASIKLGRNDPCRCGSGKKFKKCCLT